MSTVTISLTDQIVKRVDHEAEKQGFSTRSEFIRNLLRRYFNEQEKEELVFQEFGSKPLEEIRAKFQREGKYSKKFINSLIKGLSESSAYANKASK